MMHACMRERFRTCLDATATCGHDQLWRRLSRAENPHAQLWQSFVKKKHVIIATFVSTKHQVFILWRVTP